MGRYLEKIESDKHFSKNYGRYEKVWKYIINEKLLPKYRAGYITLEIFNDKARQYAILALEKKRWETIEFMARAHSECHSNFYSSPPQPKPSPARVKSATQQYGMGHGKPIKKAAAEPKRRSKKTHNAQTGARNHQDRIDVQNRSKAHGVKKGNEKMKKKTQQAKRPLPQRITEPKKYRGRTQCTDCNKKRWSGHTCRREGC